MLSKKLKKIIMIALLICSLFTTVVHARPVNLHPENTITYVQQQKISRPKVLIYHSHFHETYKDATIFDVGEDLTKKLGAKGIIVEHVNTNFSAKGYDYCYRESRKMLLSKDLSEYALCVDLHRDSGDSATITNINGVNVARTMFVGSINNPNRLDALDIINTINNNLDTYSVNIHKGTMEKNTRINLYNAELSDNSVLLELGNLHNTFKQCQNTNVFLSEAIANYIYNK